MSPEGGKSDVCASTAEEETAKLLGATDASHESDPEFKDTMSCPPNGARRSRTLLPIEDAVKLLVFLDMFSVSLVTSLLSSYFRDLNISTEQYGLMTSAYSLSQIAGGVIYSALSYRAVSRRSILLISFLGSALSYGTIAFSSSLGMLLVGRVIVGLVKQTMTISTAIVSENTTTENRSAELSKLTAAATLSHIVGPAASSMLYQRSKMLPPMIASGMFVLNAALALILLPSERKKSNSYKKNHRDEKPADGPQTGQFLANLKRACSNGLTLRIIVAKLFFGFLMRSLGARNFVGYYEGRFGVESAALGYIASYTMGVSFLAQVYLVGRLTARYSEKNLVWWGIATSTLVNLAEGTAPAVGIVGYLALVVPVRSVANAALMACMQSIFTQRVPRSDLGAALSTLDVLGSASGVVGPLYGATLVGMAGVSNRANVMAAHYAVFFVFWWVTEMRGRARGGTGLKGFGDRMNSGVVKVENDALNARDDASLRARRKVE